MIFLGFSGGSFPLEWAIFPSERDHHASVAMDDSVADVVDAAVAVAMVCLLVCRRCYS